jgi:protein-S-isoprenylcysteine O-methyltransferase Ste14
MGTPPALAGPEIRFPPPFLFVLGWVAAWLFDRWLPCAIDPAGASPAQEFVGTVLLAAGLAGAGWGMLAFARARTAIVPMRAARVLVRSGPYRFTRNPMYLGLTAAYVGLAGLFNLAWPLIVLPAVLVALSGLVIAREERHLSAKFGAEYEAYAAQVRRWL